MSTQFVDMNADGIKDILAGSFEGTPQLIEGTEKGYSEPKRVTDKNGDIVLISDFWNFEEEKWDDTDRSKSLGHCTSASAVDWDNDGDFDLLLGDYYGGRLYVRLNEGSAKQAKFAVTNSAVLADGSPIVIESGLAAPRVVDWNGDGLFDLLCGGAKKGGVFYFKNIGTKTEPKFASSETLIEPVDDPKNSFIRQVPAKNGLPTLPGSSFHIEPCDVDGDGDLDLLVGARSSWLKANMKKLSAEDKKEIESLKKQLTSARKELQTVQEKFSKLEDGKKLAESEEWKTVFNKYQSISKKLMKFDTNPTKSGDFVWLFRRK